MANLSGSSKKIHKEDRQAQNPDTPVTPDPVCLNTLCSKSGTIRQIWRLCLVVVGPDPGLGRACVRSAPLSGRDAHLVLERTLEGCL